jgi:TorA maturation chaperone TorD
MEAEMTRSQTKTADLNLAVRRAVAYELLARCLAYPDDDGVAAMNDLAGLAGGLLDGTPVAPIVEAAAEATRGGLEETYVRIFTLSTSTDCPTFESAMFGGDHIQQTERMADIAGFYRAFGVDPRAPGFRPDDICVELEFMGFLCRKQAYAAEHLGAPRVSQVLRAERMFLREHLGRWAGSLGQRVSLRTEPGSFYHDVGRALDAWLIADAAFIGAGPIEAVDIPALTWTRPDEEKDGPDPETEPNLIDFDDIPVI